MPPEQPVRIDAHPGIASQRARADLDASPFSRLDNRAELRIRGQTTAAPTDGSASAPRRKT